MVAEAGNFFVVLPFMFTAVAALLVIWFAMKGDRKRPTLPNITARRKHPLRHLQVELNRARKTVPNKLSSHEEGEEPAAGDRPRRRRDPGDGHQRLRRLK